MAITTAGEIWGYMAPTAGNTVEVPIVLTDSAGAKVTGIAFNDAGMAVSYRKEGAHTFSAFPTFATENWAECGYGEYVIILRQSDATELALMGTEGTLTFYVVCDATGGDLAKIKVNPADVARDDQWTDARATNLDNLDMAISDIPAGSGSIILSARSREIIVEGGIAVDGNGDIEVTRDDDNDIRFTWLNEDVTDCTIYLTVRETMYSTSTDDDDAIFQVTAELTDPENGIFTFTIGKAETDKSEVEKRYWYDICVIDGENNVTTILNKLHLRVSGDVTRRTTTED